MPSAGEEGHAEGVLDVRDYEPRARRVFPPEHGGLAVRTWYPRQRDNRSVLSEPIVGVDGRTGRTVDIAIQLPGQDLQVHSLNWSVLGRIAAA